MEQLAVEPGSAAGVHVDAGTQAQAQDLRGRLVAELRDGLLDQAASMPLRNYAALARVISLCRDRQASARSIALEAGRDETFAALLLRIANSAYSAAVVPIGTLTHAVARLGLDFVHGLAVATIGVPGLDVAHHARGELAAPLRELHRHSVRTGLVARSLAPAGVEPEAAMTAGLLHNLGLSVYSLFLPKAFGVLLEAAAGGRQLAPVEREILGFTHAELGALLAERWSYPPALVTAMRDHDAEAPETPLGAVVQVADLLVREAGAGIETPAPVPPAVARLAGVNVDAVSPRVALLLHAQELLDARMDDELERALPSI